METQPDKVNDRPAKWSILGIGSQAAKPTATVKASVTVISDKDRIMEIQRLEMDRILFWNA